MRHANILLATIVAGFTASAFAQPVVLYDSLWIVDTRAMDAGTGNAIGGLNGPTHYIIDSQIADDFSVDGPHRITRVVADIMTYNGTIPAEGIWVQFYRHDVETGKPEEAVFAEHVVSPAEWTVTEIQSPLNFRAWRIDMDLTAADIVLDDGLWWVNCQPLDIATNGDWFWYIGSVTVPTIGLRSHVRDGWLAHGNSYRGLWNSTTWIPHNFRGNNSLSMLIEGEPINWCDPCDTNCSGNVNGFDIDPFINIVFFGARRCSPCAGDANGDGNLDAFDVEPFITCLFGP